MRTLSVVVRALLLVLVIVAPAVTQNLALWPRLILLALYLTAVVLSDSAYRKSVAGNIELLGGVLLIVMFGVTIYLVKLNQSEALGVVVGGLMGLFYLVAIGLCGVGLLIGLVTRIRSRKKRNGSA